MKKRRGKKDEKKENLDFFKSKGIGANFLNLVVMAEYLVKNGHNSELFNPYSYPLQKLIKTFKIAKINEMEDKNEHLFAMIAAISSAFGDKESVLYFKEKQASIRKKI